MAALSGLGPEDSLLLVAPVEPVPLSAVLEGRDLASEAEQVAADRWQVAVLPA